jgi:hypothetical protein
MTSSFACVINRFLGLALILLIAGATPLLAATSATVTEAVNDVSHGTSQSAVTAPAKVGTQLQDGEYLKTGVKSRAELTLANQTITRLGANTIFNYTASTNEVDLESGTVLFSKPKDAQPMEIKSGAVTAAIVGTTGFVQKTGKGFLFGLIEGHATLTIGGITYNIAAGQILKFSPGQLPQIYSFNVPALLKTSPLITKFHHPLPNQLFIDKEVAEYDDLVARGFVQPPAEPFYLTDFEGGVPSVPIPATDSSKNALQKFNNPTPPPPPPPPPYNPSSG